MPQPIMYITRMCGLPQSHGHSDRAGVGDLDDLAVQVDGGAGLGRELHLIGLSIQVADLLALRDHVIIQVDIDQIGRASCRERV